MRRGVTQDYHSADVATHQSAPIEVFCCYSQKDRELRDQLESHLSLLKRKHEISVWHGRAIGAGREWEGEISTNLERADIVLLLVSADFLASDYCYDVEMRRALERQAIGAACVIPIILRAVDWHDAPFSALQAVPTNGHPITSWPNRDEAFADVAGAIRDVVVELANARRKTNHIATRPHRRWYYPQAQRQLIDETTRAFVGRRDIEDAFDSFIGRNSRGFFIVEGAPGDGKTALAAHVVKGRGSVHHFVSRTAGRSQPRQILCSLLEQLGTSSSSFDPEKLPASELSRLLEDGLRTTASDGKPLVVVLDALNELDADDIGCPFVPVEGLPSHVYFFVTSQPGEQLNEWKESLLAVPHEIHRLPPLSSDEVRQIVDERFPTLDERVRSSIVDAARGNALYVRAAMDAYEQDANFDPAELPDVVEGYFRRAIRLAHGSELLHDVLGLLAVSRKPLSLFELSELTTVSQRRVSSQGILPVRQFLIEAKGEYTFYHQKFHDFVIKSVLYRDELSRYHATIAEWLQRPSCRESDYRFLSLAHHLFYSGSPDRLSECIDESFLLKKLRRFGYSVLEDIELVARSLLDAGDASVIERCISLVERLRSTMGAELIDDVAKRVQPNRLLTAATSHRAVRPQFKSIPGIDLHAVMLPKGQVTADFVEVVPLVDRLVIAIGDAPSSGLQSAFVARFIASVFRRLVETSRPLHLGQVLSELNQMISSHDYFPSVSMQCVELTPAAGIVAVANAGHPYPVFYSAMRQKSDVVPIQGPRLHGSQIKGAGPAYEQRHLEIAEGDVIVLMSDGLTEIGRLVDPYGDRFTTLVEKRAAADAKSICQAILDDWLAHPRDPQWIDDLSIVVIVVARRGQNARHAVD
jgi:hypothetical protein